MRLKTIGKWSLRVVVALVVLAVLGILGTIIMLSRGIEAGYGGYTQVVDPARFQVDARHTAITNVSVLSPDGESMLAGQTVLLRDRKIVAISANEIVPEGFVTIDGSGKYLIPGLTDSHIHLHRSPNDLLLYVATGVTQVRSMNSSETDYVLKREIENGRLGPHYYVSTPSMNSSDGFGALGEGMFPTWIPSSVIFSFLESTTGMSISTSPAQAADDARAYVEAGRDGIKLYGFLNMESYRAILEVAEEMGVPAVGHMPDMMPLNELRTTKLQEIAHIEELVKALQREARVLGANDSRPFLTRVEHRAAQIARDLANNDIAVHSTLFYIESIHDQIYGLEDKLKSIELQYANPGLIEGNWTSASGMTPAGWLPGRNRFEMFAGNTPEEIEGSNAYWNEFEAAHHILLKAIIEHGATVLAATDTGGWMMVPGFALHEELHTLAVRGMSPAQALRAATAAPAARIENNAGVIDVGRRADLVLLNGNPLENIKNTQSIETVILDGRVLDRARLDAILDAVEAANNESRTMDISAYL